MAIRCPKCGSRSENQEICDTCGAVFAKIRARQADEEFASGLTGGAAASPAHFFTEDAGKPKLTKLLLIALAIGALGAFLFLRDRSSEGAQLEKILEFAQVEETEARTRRTGSILLGTSRLVRDDETSPRATLVNFWAPWCGPCKMYEPVLDQVANEFGKDLKVVKLNLDENPTPAEVASVRAVPSILLFDEAGTMTEHFTGGPPPEQLRSAIQAAMK